MEIRTGETFLQYKTGIFFGTAYTLFNFNPPDTKGVSYFACLWQNTFLRTFIKKINIY